MDTGDIKLLLLENEYSILKMPEYAFLGGIEGELVSVTKARGELSLVCPAERAPSGHLERSDGWKALRIDGRLDFALTGVIAGISGALSEEKIPVFVISTFLTDYLLVREDDVFRAVDVLSRRGYSVSVGSS